MTTYVFPGQGSQTRGMGAELFPLFPDLVQAASQILGYSIQGLCLEGHDEQLNKTHYTQPALFVVNALTYLKKLEETGAKPHYVAGHSLGEYNALFAAGVFDFATGLRLVQQRGELMSQATGGAMAAIVGLNNGDVQKLIEAHQLLEIRIANYNSHTQVVISGPKDDIIAAQPFFEQAGAMFILLKVSGAFHSPFMGSAQQHFAQFLHGFQFNPPTIPVIANVNATPYPLDAVSAHLAHQITHPVQWTKTIEYLMQQGETDFQEVGPGKILTGLIRRIQKGQ